MKKCVLAILILFSADVWALSYAQRLITKKDTANFCIRIEKNGELSLEIKDNIGIKMPLPEIEQAIACNNNEYGWAGQIDLTENYEIDFPETWDCTTLVPLVSLETCRELQENFLGDKIKRTLSKKVSHKCYSASIEQVDGQVLDGEFHFKTSKSNELGREDSFSYEYTKRFKVRIDGLCR